MKIERLLSFVLLLTCACALVGLNATVYAQRKLSPGLESYTPTKMEWLIMDLQANGRTYLISDSEYSLDYLNSTDAETVTIFVRYRPNINREGMNIAIDTAKYVIQSTAKRHKWDDWVKIREDVQMSSSRQ